MSKHTPGPWVYDPSKLLAWWEGYSIYTADRSRYIGKAGTGLSKKDVLIGLANARLIAAAPDMYELLESILKSSNLGEVYVDKMHEHAKTIQSLLNHIGP